MSKKIRNKQPSQEKINKAKISYTICKMLTGDVQGIINNLIKMYPDVFIRAVKTLGIKKLNWMGVIDWIEENKKTISEAGPMNLQPNKINYIKICRTLNDIGLREAKELVENYCYEKNYIDERQRRDLSLDAQFEEVPF